MTDRSGVKKYFQRSRQQQPKPKEAQFIEMKVFNDLTVMTDKKESTNGKTFSDEDSYI